MVGTEVAITPSSTVQARKEIRQIYAKTKMPPSLKESQLSAIQLGLEISTYALHRPDWLPLLHLATGLIVETGGLLSHGSVIAHEYGLPAVANIPRATQRFQSGDKVLVDGSTGVVQLLEAAPPPV